jgi:hypothetical protein
MAAAFAFSHGKVVNKLPATVLAQSSLIRTDGNVTYVDLNKNGKLDVYEDPTKPIEDRIQDLLKKMTIEEKAGMMFYAPIRVNADGTISLQVVYWRACHPLGSTRSTIIISRISTCLRYLRRILWRCGTTGYKNMSRKKPGWASR